MREGVRGMHSQQELEITFLQLSLDFTCLRVVEEVLELDLATEQRVSRCARQLCDCVGERECVCVCVLRARARLRVYEGRETGKERKRQSRRERRG